MRVPELRPRHPPRLRLVIGTECGAVGLGEGETGDFKCLTSINLKPRPRRGAFLCRAAGDATSAAPIGLIAPRAHRCSPWPLIPLLSGSCKPMCVG